MKDPTVREVLIEAKRTYLIWNGCDCLIPANLPKEALEKRRRDEQRAVEGGRFHTVVDPADGVTSDERSEGPPKLTAMSRLEVTAAATGTADSLLCVTRAACRL